MKEKTEEEMLQEIMLDHYCSQILVLLWKGKEMRFNEIYHALEKNGVKISKPTLSEHLMHLKKKKWITRNVRGVQNVSYRLHESIRRKEQKEDETQVKNWIPEKLQEMIVFYKPSSEVKADIDIYKFLRLKLEELTLRVEIEPQIQNQSLNFGSSQLPIEKDIVKSSKIDSQYRSRLFERTDELLKLFKEWHDERLKADTGKAVK